MTPTRRTTTALAAVIALLLSGAVALTASAQAAPTGRAVALGLEAACPDRAETLVVADFERQEVLGRWIKVAGPTFGLAPTDPRPGLTAHAVDARDPRRIFVSDGKTIARSLDGGCSWSEVHVVEPGPAPDAAQQYATGSIIQLAVSGTGPRARVWAMWAPEANTVGSIRMFISDDGGDSWEERSDGLPPAYYKPTDVGPGVGVVISLDCSGLTCRRGEVLAVAPSDPAVAYVALAGEGAGSFYSTVDGGQTWIRSVGPRPFICCNATPSEMVVDPADATSVWAIEGDRLTHSVDGGRSFRAVDTGTSSAGVGGLHLSRAVDGGAQLNVSVLVDYADDRETPFNAMARSTDGGQTFEETELSEPISGLAQVAQGGAPQEILLTTSGPDDVLLYRAAEGRALTLGVGGLGRVNDPARDATAEPATWVRGFADIAAFVPGPLPGGRFPPRPRFDPLAARLADRPPVPGELLPAGLRRDLGARGTETVDYRLELPPLPTPVDVWFLVDTSGSMAGAHRGLQTGIRDIVDKLSARGFDAWYGLGVFPDGQRIPYGRYADVAPPGPELYEAINRLGTTGGGNELHPTALYQTVTGAGQEDVELPAGLGASFRPEALKIIIHASDEPYGYDGSGPTDEEAAAALVAAGVKHVGLDLTDGSTAPVASGILSPLRRDHDNMATETGTFAPPGGVDCNGDGTDELDEGDPFTCALNRLVDTVNVAPSIIAAVTGIRDDTAVVLTVADAGGIGVEIVEPTRSPVNVKVPNSLPFSVRFTCPAEMTGKVGQVALRATVRGAPSAEAVARVGCGTPAPPPPPQPRPRPPAVVVPMVIAPPQLVPDLEPAISPLNQTAPAQVAQPSPQPGMAAQPGEVATAKQRAGRDGAPPPSGHQETREPAPAPATGGTLAAGAALAVALGGWAVKRDRAPVAVRATAGR